MVSQVWTTWIEGISDEITSEIPCWSVPVSDPSRFDGS